MVQLSSETVLRDDWLDSFETWQQYGLCSRDDMCQFRSSKKTQLTILGCFSDEFCLVFRWYNFLQRQYSEMDGWIHLKLYRIMDHILEMICVLSQFENKNQIWHFDDYFSDDCCLDFRWFNFLHTVLLRWRGWFIGNFAALWTIFHRCCLLFWI